MKINHHESTGILEMSGNADISAAERLQTALAAAVRRHDNLTVDLARLEACDTAVLQLLWSARASARNTGKDLRVVAATEAVTKTARAIGLSFDDLDGRRSEHAL
jgi:anti-anti-sigma factor